MGKILPLCAFLICVSCVRPSSVETFIPVSEAASSGCYVFPVEFYDSTASYTLSFFTRRDISFSRRTEFSPSRLVVKWNDPEGVTRHCDTVYMNFGTASGSVEKYRERVCLDGKWNLAVTVGQSGPRFRGLGLICAKDGTR